MKTAETILLEHMNGSFLVKINLSEKLRLTEAMKSYASQAIDECAKEATTTYEPHWSGEQEGSTYVDRESILKVKSQLK